jgi:outer membrane receptor for ferrienterochelin and colicins
MLLRSLARLLMVILIFAIPTRCLAEEDTIDEQEELNQLLKILEKHTEIATKTKLNADFVPGMVTVLYGDDLEARGVATVWEALGLVPGLNLYQENNGVRQVLARGIGETFGSGNISFLLNNITANSTLFGTPYPLLDIPIFQVERIEVIRGPGSAIHGEFANAGVVNVITRKKGNRIIGRYGSFDTYSGGGLFSWSNPDKELRLSINLAGMESDGADVITGQDRLYGMGLGAISQAPGPANQARRSQAGFVTLDYKDFTFLVQYMEEGHGDNFGVQDALAPPADRIVASHKHWMLDARQKLHITRFLQAEFRLGWHYFETDVDNMYLFPAGFPGFPPTFPGFPNGMIIGPHYERNRYYGGMDLIWEGWAKHSLLLGWSYSKTKLTDGWQDSNFVPSTFNPTSSGEVERFIGSENVVKVGNDRRLNSLTLQDEYRINDAFTLTAGLRYDNYNDVGNAFSPRLAGVWRLTDRHILKAQYARAFRPPTFLEMYAINQPILSGNPNIKPALSDTYEIGYIYNRPRTTFRLTPFYTNLKDLIVAQSGTFANTGGAWLKGVELELEHELIRNLKLDANLSYVDTEDRDTGRQIAGSANWLANLGFNYSPRADMTLNIQYQYVGDRNRGAQDTRDKLDGYQTVNLTGNLFNLGLRGMTLRAGVKNIFAEDVRYPADANTYPDDYPQPGRQWWMQLSYEF